MIDLTKKYKTKCGYPVRNLCEVNELAPYNGEVLINGKWVKGAWTVNGAPGILTGDKKLFDDLTLVEISEGEYQQLIGGQNCKSNKKLTKVKQLDLFDF